MTKPTYDQVSRRLRSLGVHHHECFGYDYATKREYRCIALNFGDEPKKKRSPEGKAFAAILKECGFDVSDKGLTIRVAE